MTGRKIIAKSVLVWLALTSLQSYGQDIEFYNKSLPKHSVTISAGGETVLYGLGYQKCLLYNRKTRTCLDVKISYVDAFMIPVSLYAELFEKKNKLLAGVALGNYFNTRFKYVTVKDLKELLKTNRPLYSRPDFLYVPYGSVKTGYKRYFNSHHAVSIEPMLIFYPYFKPVKNDPTISQLGIKYQPYVMLTYFYQFQKQRK